MLFRAILLLLLPLSMCACFFDSIPRQNVTNGQRREEKDESSGVTCKISTSDLRWRLKDSNATISIEVEIQGKVNVLVMPSVQLTALPKKANELEQVQSWAPFNLDSGASTNKWQRLTNQTESQKRVVRIGTSPTILGAN